MTSGIHPQGKARSDRAFVTLATNPDYAIGAAALFRSLLRTGTTADLVLLYTDLPDDAVYDLCTLGVRAVHVDLLPTSHDFNSYTPATAYMAQPPSPRARSRRSTRRWTILQSCGYGNLIMTAWFSSTPTRSSCKT